MRPRIVVPDDVNADADEIADNLRHLPLAQAMAAHPAGKAWRIADMDAALDEKQAGIAREQAYAAPDGSRLRDYYFARASKYDELANLSHTHADLMQTWDDSGRIDVETAVITGILALFLLAVTVAGFVGLDWQAARTAQPVAGQAWL